LHIQTFGLFNYNNTNIDISQIINNININNINMRDLYEEIKIFYVIQEVGTKTPSSEITGNSDKLATKLTKYYAGKETNNKSIVPGHNGTVRDVSWNTPDRSKLSNREKMKALTDVPHLHQHHIDNYAEIGDMYINSPSDDDEELGVKREGNKRERLYRKIGRFGGETKHGEQHGIVKQHPHDHPEEHLRGKKYLHPIEPSEIDSHTVRRKISKMNPEERTKLLDDKTKPFKDKLNQDKIDNIKKLQPQKVLPGHNNLTMAQYAKNASRSTIG
jgi:hypothetical protein